MRSSDLKRARHCGDATASSVSRSARNGTPYPDDKGRIRRSAHECERACRLGSAAIADPFHAHRGSRCRFSFRSEEHTSELQSLMRISYAVFCLKKKTKR